MSCNNETTGIIRSLLVDAVVSAVGQVPELTGRVFLWKTNDFGIEDLPAANLADLREDDEELCGSCVSKSLHFELSIEISNPSDPVYEARGTIQRVYSRLRANQSFAGFADSIEFEGNEVAVAQEAVHVCRAVIRFAVHYRINFNSN